GIRDFHVTGVQTCALPILVRDYDPSLPEFAGDADRLTQALWNLVRNAIEAGAGTIALRTRVEHGLRIGEQAHPVALRMEIVDDGDRESVVKGTGGEPGRRG